MDAIAGSPNNGAYLTSAYCSVVADDIGLQLRSLLAEQAHGQLPLGAFLTSTDRCVVDDENRYPSSCLSHSMALLYILTAGSKTDLLRSLHRCRGLQRRSRRGSWKLLDIHQSGRPDMGDGTSRSPSPYCQRGLTQQRILTVGS